MAWQWEDGWKIYEARIEGRVVVWSASENDCVTQGRAPYAAGARQTADELVAAGPWAEAVIDADWRKLRPVCVELLAAFGEAPPPWLATLDLQHTGVLQRARELHAAGADPAMLIAGRDALYYAAWLGSAEVGTWLLSLGVPVDRTYPHLLGERRAAIHLATSAALVDERRVYPLVDALLSAGADPDARTEKGETPLHLAIEHEKWRPALAQRLVDAGADLNACTDANLPFVFDWLKPGWTPLASLGFASAGSRNVRARWLLERGADMSRLTAAQRAKIAPLL